MIWKNAIALIIIGTIAAHQKGMDLFWLGFGAYMVMLVVYHSLSLYFIPEHTRKKINNKFFLKYVEDIKNKEEREFLKNHYTIEANYEIYPDDSVISIHLIPKKPKTGLPDLIKMKIYKESSHNLIETKPFWINSLRYSRETGLINAWFVNNNIPYYNLNKDQYNEFINEFIVVNGFDEKIERINLYIKRKMFKAISVSILFGIVFGSIFLAKNILGLTWIELLDPKAVFLIFVILSGSIFSLPFLTVYKDDRNIKIKNNVEKSEIKSPNDFLTEDIENDYDFLTEEWIDYNEIKETSHYIYKLNKEDKFLPDYILIDPFTKERTYLWGQKLSSTTIRSNSIILRNWVEKNNLNPLLLREVSNKIEENEDINLIIEKSQYK